MTKDLSKLSKNGLIKELKVAIKTIKENQLLIDRQESEISRLSQMILDFKRRIFGKKSEKTKDEDNNPKNKKSLRSFFQEKTNKSNKPDKANKEKTKRSRKFSDKIPRIEIHHELDRSERICDCGSCLTPMGEEVSERLHYIPAKVKIVTDIRHKYSCKACGKTIKIAKAPNKIFPKCRATSDLISHIIISKFLDHIPFHRQSEQFNRIGIDLSRDLMCNYTIKASTLLEPIVVLMKRDLVTKDYICSDETTLNVLDNDKKSYVWVHITGDRANRIVIYNYSPNRKSENSTDFLKDFKGYHQADGYSGYGELHDREDVIYVGCMAHVRRKFFECYIQDGKGSPSYKIIKMIRSLYKVESEIKNLPFDKKKEIRLKKGKPIFDNLQQILIKHQQRNQAKEKSKNKENKKSKFSLAINYALNRYEALQVYLSNGRLHIDNNDDERAIRPLAIGRNNWLFFKSEEGAKAAANFYTIIRTAKENDIDPFKYLKYVFDNITSLNGDEEKLKAIMPHRVSANIIDGDVV